MLWDYLCQTMESRERSRRFGFPRVYHSRVRACEDVLVGLPKYDQQLVRYCARARTYRQNQFAFQVPFVRVHSIVLELGWKEETRRRIVSDHDRSLVRHPVLEVGAEPVRKESIPAVCQGVRRTPRDRPTHRIQYAGLSGPGGVQCKQT